MRVYKTHAHQPVWRSRGSGGPPTVHNTKIYWLYRTDSLLLNSGLYSESLVLYLKVTSLVVTGGGPGYRDAGAPDRLCMLLSQSQLHALPIAANYVSLPEYEKNILVI